MQIDLTGKVAIVTEAAGGIGRAAVAQLVTEGARVVAENINPVVRELASADGFFLPLPGEVAATA